MRLLDLLRPRRGAGARVARAMDEVYGRAKWEGACCIRRRLDLSSDRYIFLSDLHRGTGGGTDEFRANERAYNAALGYYYRRGHTLILLGDAEELWQNQPESVLATYRHSIELESRFHRAGRYVRLWGNHDDLWQFEDRVSALLAPLYGDPPLQVYEAVLLDLIADEEDAGASSIGELFCVHGQQGDRMSNQWSWLSRDVIRYLWRPIQRFFRISVNTPARDWYLENRHHRALYNWAERQQDLILVTGHVHTPVFESYSQEARLKVELRQMQDEAGDNPTPAQIEAQALLMARLEWARVRERKRRRQSQLYDIAFEKPWYFGTGCCCYSGGQISGIEIDRGEIRLIRWPDQAGEPRPQILARDSLSKLLSPSREVSPRHSRTPESAGD
jgi:UDP-2,3-diacylglucosamine pyrophosphatase LpxH